MTGAIRLEHITKLIEWLEARQPDQDGNVVFDVTITERDALVASLRAGPAQSVAVSEAAKAAIKRFKAAASEDDSVSFSGADPIADFQAVVDEVERLASLLGRAPQAGTAQSDDDEDMANVGRAFMEAIEQARTSDPWMKDWAPIQCLSEIIFDLLNRFDDEIAAPPSQAGMREALEKIFARMVEKCDYADANGYSLSSNVLREYAEEIRAALQSSQPEARGCPECGKPFPCECVSYSSSGQTHASKCGGWTCAAAKVDGVTCADDACDYETGVRSPGGHVGKGGER